MDWNPLKALIKAAQYPQSVLTGVASFGPGMHGGGNRGSGDIGELARGARGGFTPSQLARENLSEGEQETLSSGAGAFLGGVSSNAMDISLDPTLAVGSIGAGSKLLEGTKLAKALQAAGTVGKMGEDATKAAKAAQAARRAYQGILISGGDPGVALGAAFAIGGAEKYGARLLGRLGTEAAEDIVGKSSLERQLDPTALEKINDEYQAAVRTLDLDRTGGPEGAAFRLVPSGPSEYNPMAVEPWSPVQGRAPAYAPPSDNPVVRRARELILSGKAGTTQEALAADMFPRGGKARDAFLWNESDHVIGQLAKEGVLGPRPGTALGQREILGDPTRLQGTQAVPFSDQGARFNAEMLSEGMPVPPQVMGELQAGPTDLLPVPFGTGQNGAQGPTQVDDFVQALLSRGEPQLMDRGVASAQPFVNRMEGMELDPAILRQMAQEFRGMPQALPATTAPYQRLPVSLRDERFPPARLEERLPTPAEGGGGVEVGSVAAQSPEIPVPEVIKAATRPAKVSGVSPAVAKMPVQKQLAYYKARAERGDRKAEQIYLDLLDSISGETPEELFLRLAGG